jgi:Putative DNA-binding domain
VNASPAHFQAHFFASLFDSDTGTDTVFGAPDPLTTQAAFAVYRNTVMAGCIDALQANFPTVVRLVGGAWFRAAAARYVRLQPPRDGRLLAYGATFADFLVAFEPARDLPYLPGVARLDRAWIDVHCAADAPVVDPVWLTSFTPADLGALRLSPHPAAHWLLLDAATVYPIWSRNRIDNDNDNDTTTETSAAVDCPPEGALLTRPADAVIWQPFDAAGGAFLDACASGAPLGEAAGAALERDASADIAGLLARLIAAGALTAPTAPTGKVDK